MRSGGPAGGVTVQTTNRTLRTMKALLFFALEREPIKLRAYRGDRTGGLVFSTKTGRPLSPSNLRRDVWIPLLKRARASGQASFNVARAMGHSRSTLVDQVYARTVQSGLESVASAVASRVLREATQAALD